MLLRQTAVFPNPHQQLWLEVFELIRIEQRLNFQLYLLATSRALYLLISPSEFVLVLKTHLHCIAFRPTGRSLKSCSCGQFVQVSFLLHKVPLSLQSKRQLFLDDRQQRFAHWEGTGKWVLAQRREAPQVLRELVQQELDAPRSHLSAHWCFPQSQDVLTSQFLWAAEAVIRNFNCGKQTSSRRSDHFGHGRSR
ncbi:hypothetical protein T11_5825 [Trichinella zimbabwensis]|uniref:Uncharacterized protein n=1 Tax=Trichinella zimbabwensis TaxID=268475 RepID=A0A0V1HEJ5_9BILA|nr:hypothetical protein T11_5825 [Trichinella zimbabwensis]